MQRKSKIRIVDGKDTVGPISSLSTEEQVHLLDLADVALRTKKPDAPPVAGTRTHRKHERLKQEVKETVERLEREPSNKGRNDAA